MTWEIRFLVVLFTVMFFWIYSVEAFSSSTIVRCFESGGVIRCVQPDGTITTFIRSAYR